MGESLIFGKIEVTFTCGRCGKTHLKKVDLSEARTDFNRCMDAVKGETGESTLFSVIPIPDGNNAVLCSNCKNGYYMRVSELQEDSASSLKNYAIGK